MFGRLDPSTGTPAAPSATSGKPAGRGVSSFVKTHPKQVAGAGAAGAVVLLAVRRKGKGGAPKTPPTPDTTGSPAPMTSYPSPGGNLPGSGGPDGYGYGSSNPGTGGAPVITVNITNPTQQSPGAPPRNPVPGAPKPKPKPKPKPAPAKPKPKPAPAKPKPKPAPIVHKMPGHTGPRR